MGGVQSSHVEPLSSPQAAISDVSAKAAIDDSVGTKEQSAQRQPRSPTIPFSSHPSPQSNHLQLSDYQKTLLLKLINDNAISKDVLEKAGSTPRLSAVMSSPPRRISATDDIIEFRKALMMLIGAMDRLRAESARKEPGALQDAVQVLAFFQAIFAQNVQSPVLCQVFDEPYVFADKANLAIKHIVMRQLFECIVALALDDSSTGLYEKLLETAILLLTSPLPPLLGSEEDTFFIQALVAIKFSLAPLLERLLNNAKIEHAPVAPRSTIWAYFWAAAPTTAEASLVQKLSVRLTLILFLNRELDLRQALELFSDNSVLQSTVPTSPKCDQSLNVCFGSLYNLIQHNDDLSSHLLFYVLMANCPDFRWQVGRRDDLSKLMNLFVRRVYSFVSKGAVEQHCYLALVILLRLCEHEDVCRRLHQQVLAAVPTDWFGTKALDGITTGSFFMLVLIQCLRTNMRCIKDSYFHNNALAIVSNLTGSAANLHLSTSLGLIGFLEASWEQYLGLDEPSKPEESKVLGECIDVLSTMIGHALNQQLSNNTQLAYAVLYKQDLFIAISHRPEFAKTLQPITKIAAFMHEKVMAGERLVSADTIVSILEQAVGEYRPDPGDTAIAKPKFVYQEDAHFLDFYGPLVWSLVDSAGK